MAVTCKAMQLGAVAALLQPVAGIHGFLELSGRSRANGLVDALKAFLPGEGVPHAAKVFDKYDLRAPYNQLSLPESETLLKELGFTGEETRQMQAEMDTDGDGFVNKNEFNSYIAVPEDEPSAKPNAIELPANDLAAMQRGEPETTGAPAITAEAPVEPAEQVASPQEPTEDEVFLSTTGAPLEPAIPASSIMPWSPPADYTTNRPFVMPPIGRDEAARKLTNHAARSQDTLVDAVENAEVAEIKRSVFRSLYRLRSAQIKEYDVIARLQTQNIDDYNDKHTYREENPINHLSDADVPIEDDREASFHDIEEKSDAQV